MKKAPEKVYILIDNKYKEIPYEKFCLISKEDRHYLKKHHFIMIHGNLLEISENDWKGLCKDRNRFQYLQKLDRQHQTLSIDAFDTEDNNGTDYIPDSSPDIAERITDKILIANMMECLSLLPSEERFIIHELYFNNLSERQLAKKLGFPKKQ